MKEKKFLRNKWQLEYPAYALIGCGILSIILALSSGKTFLITSAIMPTVLGCLFFVAKNIPVASFQTEHLELKLAPLAAKTFIRYDKIESIGVEEKKIIIKIADKKKQLKLPVSLFRAEDREAVKEVFRSLNIRGNV
ncbi:hypothetical protein [Phocoenobacter skyensis]|uniref:Uncharacterized protein n=1 Tax=Phocoenobacter skyensis TaxID=97481 RepID=A0AAJ6P1V3_9PAST|nr:hypothetical protein [Pasteurella skyensis]MDP8174064.1 hypothetical protein [Pasteurella skyensis]